MQLYRLFSLLFITVSLAACSHRPHATEEEEPHEEKLLITAYNSEFELFAEADPFVAGRQGNILAHFTRLENFKPLGEGSVTISLLQEGGKTAGESAKPVSDGIYRISLQAICVIFLLLYADFKDLTLSAIVLVNLPLALIGGVLAVFFTSGIVSIPSIIGFITLFGIATRNGILLISRYQHMQQAHIPLEEMVLKGSADRLNPILMTALTAALALIPLVFNGDKPGNEIQSPMAVVVLVVLLTSTLLNMYIVPIVYEWIQKRRQKGEKDV